MFNKLNKKTEGFTIIEVLIVLAIAGLIMLIVFLAVPALQRNSRNTQYRNEASRILSATQEFINNGGGNLPSSSGDATTILSNANTPKNITNLTVLTGITTAQTPAFNTAILDTGVSCPSTVGGANITPVSASTRSIVLIYAVENSSGAVSAQCTSS
jgi:prepilin-type N-terminal cleavage/methylation domain-containing protein